MYALVLRLSIVHIGLGASEMAPESDILTDSVNAVLKWAPGASWYQDQVNGSLFQDVVTHLGEETRLSIEAGLPSFSKALHPMFASTPKNEFGALGHAATRYTLNRLFVQRHGWFVNGLYAGLGSTQLNETSVTVNLLQYVPWKVHDAFERRLSGRGLDEQDIAVLAATIETVIFEHAVEELKIAYEFLHLSTTSKLNQSQFEDILQLHMAMRITGLNKRKNPAKAVRNWRKIVTTMFPQWPYTVDFLRKLREELFPNRTMFGFRSAALMVREVEGRWARTTASWECQAIKTKLTALEEGTNTGCVRLSDFYNRSLDPTDGWQFKESPKYLRELGALDESNPDNLRLIIPNYINAPGNCVPTTKYYMACCISECEQLQVQVEGALQQPEASPEAIAAIVKKMKSSDDGKEGVLSSSLLQRLIDIGERHNGLVPLQSRLFAQWMHFVYPQQCPFPHLAGTTSAADAPDYSQATTDIVDEQTLNYFIETGRNRTRVASVGTCMTWQHDEEIFVPTLHPQSTSIEALENDTSVWASMYFVAALMSTSLYLARRLQSVWLLKSVKSTKALPAVEAV